MYAATRPNHSGATLDHGFHRNGTLPAKDLTLPGPPAAPAPRTGITIACDARVALTAVYP
jgi:hypothetical protein